MADGAADAVVDGTAGLYGFVGDSASEGSTLREFYDLPRELDAGQIWKALWELGAQDVPAEGSVPEFDDVLTQQALAGLPPDMLRRFGILAAIYSRRPILVLSEADFKLVKTGTDGSSPHALAERTLIVTCRRQPGDAIGSDGSSVVISDGDALRGWCMLSWLREHPEFLEQLGPTKQRPDAAGSAPADDLLDDSDGP